MPVRIDEPGYGDQVAGFDDFDAVSVDRLGDRGDLPVADQYVGGLSIAGLAIHGDDIRTTDEVGIAAGNICWCLRFGASL